MNEFLPKSVSCKGSLYSILYNATTLTNMLCIQSTYASIGNIVLLFFVLVFFFYINSTKEKVMMLCDRRAVLI